MSQLGQKIPNSDAELDVRSWSFVLLQGGLGQAGGVISGCAHDERGPPPNMLMGSKEVSVDESRLHPHAYSGN